MANLLGQYKIAEQSRGEDMLTLMLAPSSSSRTTAGP